MLFTYNIKLHMLLTSPNCLLRKGNDLLCGPLREKPTSQQTGDVRYKASFICFGIAKAKWHNIYFYTWETTERKKRRSKAEREAASGCALQKTPLKDKFLLTIFNNIYIYNLNNANSMHYLRFSYLSGSLKHLCISFSTKIVILEESVQI